MINPRRRALLIANRMARSVSDRCERAIALLEDAGIDVIVPDAPSKHSVARTIAAHRGECDAVIVAGGDGSLNVALQGLVKANLPLGILPLGTANDLARSLGIPVDVEGACAVIAGGIAHPIDVGRVNGVYFFNEMSIGISPTVTRLLTKEQKAKLGIFALIVRGLGAARMMRRFRVDLDCDGRRHALHTAQLTIGNGRSFGGFIQSDEASLDDHRLDLYSISFPTWWSYLEGLYALVRRRYDHTRSVTTMHGASFGIRTRRRRPIEADGEIVSMTPATVTVVPDAVRVFVPAAESS